jgi:putative tricarboxylic transport membrane protein
MLKGLLSGFLGMLFAMPGVDQTAGGVPRLTFGFEPLNSGLGLLPVLIGVFCVSQVIADVVDKDRVPESTGTSREGIFMTLRDWKDSAVNLLRSSLIGTWVGILPGVGASIGSVIAYTTAKNVSSKSNEFGKGSEEGIIASEAANNATVGGALVPLIAMGIPGSVIDAILIGALMIHSIQPGPLLFSNEPQLVYGIMWAYLIANIIMFAVMILMVNKISKLMFVKRAFLLPPILVLCILGAYANNTLFAVWVMLGFGVLGFFMERARIPLGPFVIGFVLAPIAESKLRAGLMISKGDYSPIFTRPLCLFFVICSVGLLLWPMVQHARGQKTPVDTLEEADDSVDSTFPDVE